MPNYSVRLIVVETDMVGARNVRPVADVGLCSLDINPGDLESVTAMIAGWTQTAVRSGLSGEAPHVP